MIVLLGPEYPKRIWTKFESDQFKQRFGSGSVIPIWFSDAPMGMFDEARRVGGLTFERDKDGTAQIMEFSQALMKKLGETHMEVARVDEAPLRDADAD